MKEFVLLLLIFVAFAGKAQENNTSKYPEPEFTRQPYWLNPAINTLSPFEKAPLQTYTKGKGLYGAEAYYYINNPASTVRFKANETLRFVVKMEEGEDPSDLLGVYKLDVNKRRKVREFLASSRRAWDGGVTNKIQGLEIINFKKIGQDLFEIVIDAQPPGEYSFGTPKYFFAYGLD